MMEKFHYTTESGHELVLPQVGNIKAGVWRKLRGETSNLEIGFTLLEGVCTPEQLAVVDEMSLDEINTLLGRWQGVNPGESSGSSDSSTSTAEPSSTTGGPASTSP